jgi:predicted DNA-binding transcriptional regulator AlpA
MSAATLNKRSALPQKLAALPQKLAALPPNIAPRLLHREAAAAYVNVSPRTFDEMVAAGTMPKPRILTDKRRAWDMRDLDAAVDRLPYDGGEVLEHGWS